MQGGRRGRYDFGIRESERLWVSLYHFFFGRGYQLRPRFHPNWEPPWLQGHTDEGKKLSPFSFADHIAGSSHMVDATHIDDGKKVVFKKVPTNTHEIRVATFLSSQDLMSDRRNCSVPILDVILIPGDDDWALIVMPLLLDFHPLPFRYLGEFCDFALDILKGMELLHQYNIAHRDLCWYNIMMDPTKVVPKGIHKSSWLTHDGINTDNFGWKSRWSVRPVQYYIIDFGFSEKFESKNSRATGKYGQDRTVPELSWTEMYDPFKVDVYQLGNVIKRCVQQYSGLDYFKPLAEAMTLTEPVNRPTASEAVSLCEEIISQVKKASKMKSRVWRENAQESTPLSVHERLTVILLGRNPLR